MDVPNFWSEIEDPEEMDYKGRQRTCRLPVIKRGLYVYYIYSVDRKIIYIYIQIDR